MTQKVSDEEVALRLFVHTRDERAKMAQAVKNIHSLLDGRRIEGTDFNREFSEFLSHFGNVKGFMDERYQRLSEANVKMIRIYAKGAWHPESKDAIRQRLDGMLVFPINYKGKFWKKVSAQVMAQGIGIGGSVER